MRLLAFSQIWNSFSGRYSTYRYEELHQQQLLNWGIEERGRYSSYRGMLSVSPHDDSPIFARSSSCVRAFSSMVMRAGAGVVGVGLAAEKHRHHALAVRREHLGDVRAALRGHGEDGLAL